MLRKVLALLIVLNLVWWIWARGWLAPLGLPATLAGEPERLERQIHPEALSVRPLPPGEPITKPVPVISNGTAAPEASDASGEGKNRNRKRTGS